MEYGLSAQTNLRNSAILRLIIKTDHITKLLKAYGSHSALTLALGTWHTCMSKNHLEKAPLNEKAQEGTQGGDMFFLQWIYNPAH